jgi:WD40 repeat protein
LFAFDGNTLTLATLPQPNPTVAIFALEFSPSGEYLVLGRNGAPLVELFRNMGGGVWGIATNVNIQPTSVPRSIAWSPDGQHIAMSLNASPFMQLYRIDNETGAMTQLANPPQIPNVNSWMISYNDAGTILAVGRTNSPFIQLFERAADSYVAMGALSPAPLASQCVIFDGEYLISGATNGTLQIYRFSGGTITHINNAASHAGIFYSLVAMKNGYFMGGFGQAQWTRHFLFNSLSGMLYGIYESVTSITNVAQLNASSISPDNNHVFCGLQDGYVIMKRINDVVYVPLVNPLTGFPNVVVNVPWYTNTGAYSPDGKYFVVGLSVSPWFRFYIRSGDSYVLGGTYIGASPNSYVYRLGWHPSGRYLIVGLSTSPFIIMYSVTEFEGLHIIQRLDPPLQLPIGQIMAIRWSRDGNRLYLGHNAANERLISYDLDGTQLINRRTIIAPDGVPNTQTYSIEINPRYDLMSVHYATNLENTLSLYDISGDAETIIKQLNVDPIWNGRHVRWTPDGKSLVAYMAQLGFNGVMNLTGTFLRRQHTMTNNFEYVVNPFTFEITSDGKTIIMFASATIPRYILASIVKTEVTTFAKREGQLLGQATKYLATVSEDVLAGEEAIVEVSDSINNGLFGFMPRLNLPE